MYVSIFSKTRGVLYSSNLISLHIRSMWETICDAWACWSGWNFGPNSTEYPYSEIQFQNTPPPPKMKIVRDLGTLTFQFQNTPPPQNENCQRSWHFDFSVSEYPPPRKWKLSEILALWLFSFRIAPPQNENCQRSWHFDFSVSEYPPPPKIEI